MTGRDRTWDTSRQPANACFLDIFELIWWKLDRALDAETPAASACYCVSEVILGLLGIVA